MKHIVDGIGYQEACNGMKCINCPFLDDEHNCKIGMYIRSQKVYQDRPHGEWVLDKEFSFVLNIYECSKCRFNGSKRWHFCPNCGASMRVKDELNRVNNELNSEPKDSHAEYWNSIGDWKEGEAE